MKALFEHNGFTRMEDVPDDPPRIYSIPVVPPVSFSPIDFSDPVKVVSLGSTTDIWQFELRGIEYVDNERVAIYKYTGKR